MGRDLPRHRRVELGRTSPLRSDERGSEDERCGALRARGARRPPGSRRRTPTIVTIFDVAEHDGRADDRHGVPPGGRRSRRGRRYHVPSPSQALALARATPPPRSTRHTSRGIVHRDVKPSEPAPTPRGRARADFGIASASASSRSRRPGRSSAPPGTCRRSRRRGDGPGAASDRYALAVVAWELLAAGGRSPQTRDGAKRRARDGSDPVLTRRTYAVPARSTRVRQRGLAKQPRRSLLRRRRVRRRPASCADDVAGDTWIERRSRRRCSTTRRRRRRGWQADAVGGSRARRASLVAAGIAQAWSRLRCRRSGRGAADAHDRHDASSPGPTVPDVTATPNVTPPTIGDTADDGRERRERRGAERRGLRRSCGRATRGGTRPARAGGAEAAGTGSTTRPYAAYNLAYTPLPRSADCAEV